jgi:putative transferase (TIGR04331 family)
MKNISINPNFVDYLDSNETVFCGQWTRNYNLSDHRLSKEHQLQISPVLDAKERANLELVYADNLSNIAALLNETHGVKFSDSSWEFLIGPWLRVSIFSLFVKWKAAHAIKKTNLNLIHDFKDFDQLAARDIIHFHSKLEDHNFSNDLFYLLGKLLKSPSLKLNPLNPDKSSQSSKDFKQEFITVKENFKSRFFNFVSKFLHFVYCLISNSISQKKKIFIYKTMSYKSFSFYFFYLTKIFPLQSTTDFCFDNDIKLWSSVRNSYFLKLTNNSKRYSTFDEIIFSLLVLTIPQAYLEGFKSLSEVTIKHFPAEGKYKYIFSSTAQWNNEVFKLWLMQNYSFNPTICIWQHGGTYGSTKVFSHQEFLESKLSSYFLTWGWQRIASNNNVPFIRPLFLNSKVWFQKKEKKNRILVVLTRLKTYSKGDSWDSDNWNDSYLSLVSDLVRGLSKIDQSNIIFRLHPSQAKGFDLKDYLSKSFPVIRFDDEPSMAKSMRKSTLIISTQNSTSFLQSLLLNKPSLGIWDESLINFSDIASSKFALLKTHKIYHSNTQDLLSHLVTIYPNLNKWWFNKDLQQNLNSFSGKFLNFDHRKARRALFQIIK